MCQLYQTNTVQNLKNPLDFCSKTDNMRSICVISLWYIPLHSEPLKFTEHAVLIANNSKLEVMAGALMTHVSGTVRIEDNPLLDVNCTHVLEIYPTVRRIGGNRVNCGELYYIHV